jgi:prepilin-type processing-associated H-X9-DG protein
MWAVFQGLLIISGTVTAFVLAILTPLCLLGVFIASKIMKFETPGSFFWRCAAVVCAPMSLYILLSGFGFAEPKAVSWVFGLATMLGVLWLMFRLKPLHYLVNASFVLVIMVGLPVLLFVFVLAGLGLTFGGMGVSAAKHRAMQVHSAANLKQISLALMVYANEHKGQFPPTLDILPRTTNLDPQALRTPDGEGYDYNFFPGINNGMTESYMVVNESVADEKGAVNGLFLDGHVELLSASQWEAAQLNNGRVRANRVNRGNTAAGSSSTSPPQPIENAGHAKTVVIPRTSRVAPTDPAQYHAAVEASLRRVADALDQYANAHGGKYPLNIMSLASSGLIQNSDMMSPRGIMYGLEAGNLKPPLPANVIIIYETGSTDGKRTVVWGDKRIETVDQTAFVAALKESRKSRSSLPR